MFPEPTELLLMGREISHVMNGIIFCVCSTSAIFSSTNCLEVMSKRTQEDAGEEKVRAKSKPMINLVSRYSARDPNVLASIASENPGNTESESQKVPLSSLNVQQPRTGRLVMGASSSDYSEWNTLHKMQCETSTNVL